MKECDDFLCLYIVSNPSTELLEYIYMYDMQISPREIRDNYMNMLKSIFTESLEKYVFLRTDFQDFQKHIINKELIIDDEYYLVRAILMWVQYDIGDRLRYAESLLSNVNCSLCSKMLMLNHKYIDTTNKVLESLIIKIHLQISILNDNDTAELIDIYNLNQVDTFRIPMNKETMDVLINKRMYGVAMQCNLERDHVDVLVKYACRYDQILYTSKDMILFVSFNQNNMIKYDVKNKVLINCCNPPLNDCNYPPTINEISGDRIVAIGGLCNDPNTSIERSSDKVWYYDIAKDCWTEQASLPHAVWMHSTVVVGNDIYVTGGIVNDETSNKALKYNNGTWTYIAQLNGSRRSHICVSYNNCIYVYGGHNRTDSEWYDLATGDWSTYDTDLYNEITCDTAAIYGGKIYASDITGRLYAINLDTMTKVLIYRNVGQEDWDIPFNSSSEECIN